VPDKIVSESLIIPADQVKIVIPNDRTCRQPVTAYCTYKKCLVNGKRFEFPTEGNVHCPKCGATEAPTIGLLALVHLMVEDPAGPIPGEGGLRWRLACDPTREHLATVTNMEAASDQIVAVNCPGCLKVAEQQKLGPQPWKYNPNG
jgi:hypothetical protein